MFERAWSYRFCNGAGMGPARERRSKAMRVRNHALAKAAGVAASFVVAGSLATATATAPAGAATRYASARPASARVSNNTLLIEGTAGDDTVSVTQGADPNQLLVDTGTGPQAFDRGTFNAVQVDLGDGNDSFEESSGIVSDEQLTVHGGPGDDKILTGDGNDLIFGDQGNDVINSGKGNDVIFGGQGDDGVDGGIGTDIAFLGNGNDTFQWDPGDGSDIVNGGPGVDTMLFDGGSGADTASLSPNGHHSLFLRDPGNIRMDMDSIEALQFNAGTGADTMTVNDMQGTSIRRVGIDLGTPGDFGGADGALDKVIVNGTRRADHVNVTGGSAVDVAGLHAETSITSVDPTDELHVNTGDGNDTVNVDATAASMMTVLPDLGAGQR
jgi:Ca2+-binding RTX toxin-like protein